MAEEEYYGALLAWVSSVSNNQLESFKDLWDGQVFYNIMKQIEHMSVTEFKSYSEQQSWTSVLTNIKRLYKDLEDFYRLKLGKSTFDNIANTLDIAQNKDPEHIYYFSLQIFGAAVMAVNKEMFVSAILKLKPSHQTTLMNLIQRFKFIEGEESVIREEDQSSHQKRVLLAKVQSLEAENENLEKQVQQILNSKRQSEQRCKRLEEEYRKLKQQFQNKLYEIDNQPQSEIKINTHMEEVNTNMIQELNARLRETIENSAKQKRELEDHIEFLKEKVQKYQQERENRDKGGPSMATTSMAVPDHPPCISMTKHQQQILKQAAKMKECMKREMELNMQNANLKKQVDGMRREIDKMKNDFIKKSDAINRDDYDAVKLNVLQMLRDKFKEEVQKLQAK